jgi:hypothetical protein
MLYREIIAVCSQIHTKHINTLCGQNAAFSTVKANSAYLKNTDLFLKQRLIMNVAAVPVRTVTILAGMSVGSGRTSHVCCVVITKAMQWCEQIKQYWLLIRQHVSTGTQIYAVRPYSLHCQKYILWACLSQNVTNAVANRDTLCTRRCIAASTTSCHLYLRTINAPVRHWHFELPVGFIYKRRRSVGSFYLFSTQPSLYHVYRPNLARSLPLTLWRRIFFFKF